MKRYYKYFDIFKFICCMLVPIFHLLVNDTVKYGDWLVHVREMILHMFIHLVLALLESFSMAR